MIGAVLVMNMLIKVRLWVLFISAAALTQLATFPGCRVRRSSRSSSRSDIVEIGLALRPWDVVMMLLRVLLPARVSLLAERGVDTLLITLVSSQNVVFSMPGGFGGPKPGYQNIDDDLEEAAGAPSTAPPQHQPIPGTLPGVSPHSHQAQVNAQVNRPQA